MNIGTIKGKNYEYGGGVIDFFGYKAVCSNGVWSANWIYREGFYPIKRDPSILAFIAECIAIDVKAGNGEVVGVYYVNTVGVMSKNPFPGVNVVVTRYSDGSRSSVKKVFK